MTSAGFLHAVMNGSRVKQNGIKKNKYIRKYHYNNGASGCTSRRSSRTDRSLKRKQRAVKQTKKRPSRKKTATAAPVARPECLMIAGEGSCPKGKTRQVNGLP
jgi:hypothetical protein